MAKDDHWFKFYYRLMLVSTQGWKDDEFGAYVRLLIHQFDKGGLPDDPGELSKLVSTFKKNWPALSKKFKKGEDGLLRNDFMKAVRDERDKKSALGSEFGKKGGRGNKKETLSENKGNPLENQRESLSLSPSYSVSKEERGVGKETNDSLVCSDAEKLILENQIQFEIICMKASAHIEIDQIKEALRKFHLYLVENNRYPMNSKQIFSGFERWLMNEKNFNNAGNGTGKKNNIGKPVITGTASGAGSI